MGKQASRGAAFEKAAQLGDETTRPAAWRPSNHSIEWVLNSEIRPGLKRGRAFLSSWLLFQRQKRFFAGDPAAAADEFAVGSDDAVAGDEDGNRVAPRLPIRPRGKRLARRCAGLSAP